MGVLKKIFGLEAVDPAEQRLLDSLDLDEHQDVKLIKLNKISKRELDDLMDGFISLKNALRILRIRKRPIPESLVEQIHHLEVNLGLEFTRVEAEVKRDVRDLETAKRNLIYAESRLRELAA